jgi:glycosyltransferase involved in cell wall biosynthesis/GT2 family glycosyltransferase
MRLCLVSREVRPFVGGGIATYIAEMANALVAAGHEVHILTAPQDDLQRRGAEAMPGVTFHAVQVDQGKSALPGAFYAEATRYAFAVLEALRPLHERLKFDVIEFPEYRGEGYWCLRAKRTLGDFGDALLSVRLHSPHYLCLEVDRQHICGLDHAHIEHMEKSSVREADVVLAASHAMMDRMIEDVGDAMPAEVVVPREIVRLPMDFGAIERTLGHAPSHREEPLERASASKSQLGTILYFGRLQVCKGTQDLVQASLRAFARGLDARVIFIGGDTHTGPFGRSMREYLERKSTGEDARFQSRFEFVGPRQRHELGEAIRGATMCVFPSLWESYSYACVEAMALGAPVIVSDAGSLKEIVEHDVSGIIYPAGDVAALERAIMRLAGDADLRSRLGEQAKARAHALSEAGGVVASLERAMERTRPLAAERTRRAHEVASRASRPRATVATASSHAPPVTVIIPHYNLARTLPDTLESLQRQTFRDFDTVIIDDGSTDPASVAYLQELRQQGLRVLRKSNGGLGSARNLGFHEARSEFVVPLDADDIAHPQFVEKLYKAIRHDDGLAAVSCMFESFYEKPGEGVSGYAPLAIDPDLLLYHNIAGPGAASILHRDTVLSVGGYDEWLTSFEDWDLWCTLAGHGYRGKAIPEFLLYYRLRPDSLIRSEAPLRWHALKAYVIAKHKHLANDPSIVLRMQLAETYQAKDQVITLEREIINLRSQIASLGGTAPAHDARPMETIDPGSVHFEAKRIIQENLRYRLADSINNTLKSMGVHKAVKQGAKKAIEIVRKPKG